MVSICSTVVLLLSGVCFRGQTVLGFGRLWDPPARSTMWRRGFDTPINFNDESVSCGGPRLWRQVQHILLTGSAVPTICQNNGDVRGQGCDNTPDVTGGNTYTGTQCGVCGDPLEADPENEAGGKYATGKISHIYSQNENTNFEVNLPQHKTGYLEFKLCPTNNPEARETQQCFDQHPVKLADRPGNRYHIGSKRRFTKVPVQLPPYLVCNHCVLQWHFYQSTNHEDENAEQWMPEESFGCSDIQIVGGESSNVSSSSKYENVGDEYNVELEDTVHSVTDFKNKEASHENKSKYSETYEESTDLGKQSTDTHEQSLPMVSQLSHKNNNSHEAGNQSISGEQRIYSEKHPQVADKQTTKTDTHLKDIEKESKDTKTQSSNTEIHFEKQSTDTKKQSLNVEKPLFDTEIQSANRDTQLTDAANQLADTEKQLTETAQILQDMDHQLTDVQKQALSHGTAVERLKDRTEPRKYLNNSRIIGKEWVNIENQVNTSANMVKETFHNNILVNAVLNNNQSDSNEIIVGTTDNSSNTRKYVNSYRVDKEKWGNTKKSEHTPANTVIKTSPNNILVSAVSNNNQGEPNEMIEGTIDENSNTRKYANSYSVDKEEWGHTEKAEDSLANRVIETSPNNILVSAVSKNNQGESNEMIVGTIDKNSNTRKYVNSSRVDKEEWWNTEKAENTATNKNLEIVRDNTVSSAASNNNQGKTKERTNPGHFHVHTKFYNTPHENHDSTSGVNMFLHNEDEHRQGKEGVSHQRTSGDRNKSGEGANEIELNEPCALQSRCASNGENYLIKILSQKEQYRKQDNSFESTQNRLLSANSHFSEDDADY